MVRVVAMELGYYGDARRRPGDVFEIPIKDLRRDEEDTPILPSWVRTDTTLAHIILEKQQRDALAKAEAAARYAAGDRDVRPKKDSFVRRGDARRRRSASRGRSARVERHRRQQGEEAGDQGCARPWCRAADAGHFMSLEKLRAELATRDSELKDAQAKFAHAVASLDEATRAESEAREAARWQRVKVVRVIDP